MLDAETLFSNKQNLAAGPSDNIIQTPNGLDGEIKYKGNIGTGRPVYLEVIVHNVTGGPLTVTLNSSDIDTMAGAVAVASYVIPADQIAQGGSVLTAQVPSTCKKFLQLQYSGSATGGQITAGLVLSGQTNT